MECEFWIFKLLNEKYSTDKKKSKTFFLFQEGKSYEVLKKELAEEATPVIIKAVGYF